jgi:hypothetical protein
MLRALPKRLCLVRIRAGTKFKYLFNTQSKILVRKTTRCAFSETQNEPARDVTFPTFRFERDCSLDRRPQVTANE